MSSSSSLALGAASPSKTVRGEKAEERKRFNEHAKQVIKLAGLATKFASTIYGSKDVAKVTFTHNGVVQVKELTKTEFGKYKKTLKTAIKELAKEAIKMTTRKRRVGASRSGFNQPRIQDETLVRFFSDPQSGANLGPTYNVGPASAISIKDGKMEFAKDAIFEPNGGAVANLLTFTQPGTTAYRLVSNGTLTALFHLYSTASGSQLPMYRKAMLLRPEARRALRSLIIRAIDADEQKLRAANMLTAQAQQVAAQMRAAVDAAPNPPATPQQAQARLDAATFPTTGGKKVRFFNPDIVVYSHLSKLAAVKATDAAGNVIPPAVEKAANQAALAAVQSNPAFVNAWQQQNTAIATASGRNKKISDARNAQTRKDQNAIKSAAKKAAKLAGK